MSLDFNDLALRTIQSQYGASPHIIGIVEAAAKQLIEDAKALEKMIQEQHPGTKVIIGNLGAVIGSHAGPGTLALFFMGEVR